MKHCLWSLVLSLCFTVTILGADPKTGIPSQKPVEKAGSKKPKGMPFNGTIANIDKSSNTISLGKTKIRIFHLSAETKITKNKVPAKVDDIAKGDHVGGYAFENAEGKLEVKTLNVSDVTKNTKPEPEKKKS